MRLYVEWIPHLESYRLYDPESPQNTCGYSDTITEAIDVSLSAGYSGVSARDLDTIKQIEKSEPQSIGDDCILEKASNLFSQKEINKHLSSIPHDEYIARLYQEPEEYINYFDQILNQQEWKADLTKPEQFYLEAFEKTLRFHVELYNIIRLPLHDEIPFLDLEAVKLLKKKHPSLSEATIASAVNDYSPYTIVFQENAYGISMAKEISKANVR